MAKSIDINKIDERIALLSPIEAMKLLTERAANRAATMRFACAGDPTNEQYQVDAAAFEKAAIDFAEALAMLQAIENDDVYTVRAKETNPDTGDDETNALVGPFFGVDAADAFEAQVNALDKPSLKTAYVVEDVEPLIGPAEWMENHA